LEDLGIGGRIILKQMLKETLNDVGWPYLVHNTDQWRTTVITVIHPRVPQKAANIVIS
jgi:hypothetical protein